MGDLRDFHRWLPLNLSHFQSVRVRSQIAVTLNPLDIGLVRDDNGVTWRFLPAVEVVANCLERSPPSGNGPQEARDAYF
jgi:hypothetical protein